MNDISDTCQNDTSNGMICQTFVSKLDRAAESAQWAAMVVVGGCWAMDTQKRGSLFYFFVLFKILHNEK